MSKNQAKAATDVVVISENLPAYLADHNGPARGMEDVTAADVVIPRLEIVQSLSPARDKTSPMFIPGAEEGHLFNSVTRELYGTEVMIVPVVFKKQWIIWKDRKQGGGTNGFRGAFNSEIDAKRALAELSEQEQGLEIVDTAQHFCYVFKADGSTEEMVVSMAKSKQKVSKRWNSLMRIAGGDSFSRVYRVSSITETNARNEKYQNFDVKQIGYAPESVYRRAEALYNQIQRGGVVVDQNYEGDGQPGHEEKEF